MGKIFITSDFHFSHDKEFIWKARGFSSIEEMNETIIERHNSIVSADDDVYVLGDLCLGGPDKEAVNKALIERLNGRLHVVFGNHDTAKRQEMYKNCGNIVEVCGWAAMLKYGKYHFYLSHFPTLTSNIGDEEKPWQKVQNLYGHTHQTTEWLNNENSSYHVGMDAHDCYPVLIDDIIEEIKVKNQYPHICEAYRAFSDGYGCCMVQKHTPSCFCHGDKSKCECPF